MKLQKNYFKTTAIIGSLLILNGISSETAQAKEPVAVKSMEEADEHINKSNTAAMLHMNGCHACMKAMPIFLQTARNDNDLDFITIESHVQGLRERFKPNGFPTYVLFVDGKEVKRKVGDSLNKQILDGWKSKYITKSKRSRRRNRRREDATIEE